MLRIEKLKVGTLPPLSFELADGECVAVIGPSGSGKTRLLRAIADFDPATGHVFLDGAERREMPAFAWRRLVRYMSAEPAWWTDTARAAFPASLSPQRLARLLSSLGLDLGILDAPLATASTGERQRLALARAIADEPRVLLFDEPTAALDPANAALVEELIRYQMLAGRPVLLVSHDAGLSGRLATSRLELARPEPARPEPGGEDGVTVRDPSPSHAHAVPVPVPAPALRQGAGAAPASPSTPRPSGGRAA